MLNEKWWFARIPPHPAPSSLRLQLRVAGLLYVLVLGVPTAADLVFNHGSYNGLHITFVIPTVLANISFVILAWFLIRSEGGTWRPFWNDKFVPNAICLFVTAFVLTLAQNAAALISGGLMAHFPRVAPYCTASPSNFSPSLMLSLAASMIASQEILARAFVMTRIREAGGTLGSAIAWSTALFVLVSVGWGIDSILLGVVSGVVLGLAYARWGGLAGLILGRFTFELSNYLQLPM